MIALICFIWSVSTAPFKLKNRLELENVAFRHQVVVLQRNRVHQPRSAVLHPAVSMVPIGPQGDDDRPARDSRALASGWLLSRGDGEGGQHSRSRRAWVVELKNGLAIK
jgi:hypothetical protein